MPSQQQQRAGLAEPTLRELALRRAEPGAVQPPPQAAEPSRSELQALAVELGAPQGASPPPLLAELTQPRAWVLWVHPQAPWRQPEWPVDAMRSQAARQAG